MDHHVCAPQIDNEIVLLMIRRVGGNLTLIGQGGNQETEKICLTESFPCRMVERRLRLLVSGKQFLSFFAESRYQAFIFLCPGCDGDCRVTTEVGQSRNSRLGWTPKKWTWRGAAAVRSPQTQSLPLVGTLRKRAATAVQWQEPISTTLCRGNGCWSDFWSLLETVLVSDLFFIDSYARQAKAKR